MRETPVWSWIRPRLMSSPHSPFAMHHASQCPCFALAVRRVRAPALCNAHALLRSATRDPRSCAIRDPRSAIRDPARFAIRDPARFAIRDPARFAIRDPARFAIRDPARFAILRASRSPRFARRTRCRTSAWSVALWGPRLTMSRASRFPMFRGPALRNAPGFTSRALPGLAPRPSGFVGPALGPLALRVRCRPGKGCQMRIGSSNSSASRCAAVSSQPSTGRAGTPRVSTG